MKNFLRTVGSLVGVFVICALVCFLVYSCVSYDMGRYKRKFPNSTTMDYWWDGGK